MHRKQRCERRGGPERHGDKTKTGESIPYGTCTTMCPISEVRRRETQRQLHFFEMECGTEKERMPRADLSRMVKEYSRPAAGKDSTRACDLRPPDVLLRTVCYLVDEIAASPARQSWIEVYNFVFDRLRSVRQDMVIQRVSGWECVAVLERTVRFHLYASYRLCGVPLRLYDPHINDTHLQECLSWLMECYSKGQYEHQAEFQALCLLYNLGNTRTLQCALELSKNVRLSPPVQLALTINRAYIERNPVRLLRLAQKLDFIQACAFHKHLLSCRKDLLLLYSHGHNNRNCRFPIKKLADVLFLECSLVARLCQAHGLQVNQDCVVFSKAAFCRSPCKELQCAQMHKLVDDKQEFISVSSIIHGIS